MVGNVIRIDTQNASELSPYVFGHNLEHTRAAVNGGISAQMLKNRKFAGKPAKNSGVADGWRGIGERAFFQLGGRGSYTRHIGCEKMRRGNELQAQSVQNLSGGPCGIAQDGLYIRAGEKYEVRVVTKSPVPVTLVAELTGKGGHPVYARRELTLAPGEWQANTLSLTPDTEDNAAELRLVFNECTEVLFGAASMMPEDNFRGMRSDVVALLKEIGPAIIRWPGGNFAGEYRWKDGLLESDMRGSLAAAMEDETQPYSHGFDFHEISTDDFIALCREVGAEPFLTINLVWNSPEDSADWVEYCNAPADTGYGKKRAENGHAEPYNVKFWSLGNEMGYGHMEGPMKPEDYAALAETHVKAMREVSDDLEFFSSGPYPDDAWADHSASALAEHVMYASLHHYSNAKMDYTSPEKIKETYESVVSEPDKALFIAREMRECLDRTGKKLLISFDEWNFWYSWYRPSCVSEGIFAAKMLHTLIRHSNELGMPVCCYFQPVGEGAMTITPSGAELTANGQMFSLMKAHKGGKLCETEPDDGSVLATVKDGIVTVTLINDSYGKNRVFGVAGGWDVSGSVLYSSKDVLPYSRFDISPLGVEAADGELKCVLPPHSAAGLTLKRAVSKKENPDL